MNARVLTFVERARRALSGEGREALIAAVSAEANLSKEGVRAVFDRSLAVELAVSNDELESLSRRLGSTRSPPEIHLVLSSTVFSSALRAIVCALARSEKVSVSPSSEARVFAMALAHVAGRDLVTVHEKRPLSTLADGSEIHVFGSSETIAVFEDEASREGRALSVVGHGPGFGIAIVRTDEDATRDALALDASLFDQEGCLSPRLVFFAGNAAAGEAFVRGLAASFESMETIIPRGTLAPETLAEIERYASTAAIAGTLHRGATYCVSLSSQLEMPPIGRNLHVVSREGDELGRSLERFSRTMGRLVTNIGTEGGDLATRELLVKLFPNVRISILGAMQTPPLDGPADLR